MTSKRMNLRHLMYDAGSVIPELCNPGSVAKLTQNSVIELLSIIFHFYFT